MARRLFRRAALAPIAEAGFSTLELSGRSLRHFFITQCFAGGAGGPTVQRLAGHCHLSVTQRYAHTTDALMREAVQVFGRRAG